MINTISHMVILEQVKMLFLAQIIVVVKRHIVQCIQCWYKNNIFLVSGEEINCNWHSQGLNKLGHWLK